MLDKIYGSVISLRNCLYDKSIFKSYLTPPAIVSIGNIEAGGTGKTPFTMALAIRLKENGHNVAIVTRGYGGRLKGPIQVMAGHDYIDVGDEPILMASKTGTAVVKCADRRKGALYAYRKLGAQVVLLDDGFQHRRIFRDVDICLISKNIGSERLLPSGMLREPPGQLKRADFVIDAATELNLIGQGLVDRYGNGVDKSIEGRVFAFCGIANPERFFDTLLPDSSELKTLSFRDHHKYSPADVRSIVRNADKSDMIITTEKDLVRLKPEWLDERFFALSIKVEIKNLEAIVREIEKVVSNRRISRQG